MIWYDPPASTLGRSWPRWIRCTIAGKSTVLPVSGSEVCGEWQSTQSATSRRCPPWAESGLWQPLHDSVFTTSRTVLTNPPAGTKSWIAFAT
jgi:hypothetical protein